ncbi:cytochrome C [Mesobaculum littorinae]|uniref:Cytochrome C n=2 Tax=Mesobaculum littorinae TaxID=2486419 RepID=A0A438AHP4_9RHOB|nr:cytochrome C [Mesobaculum littorinae]RVV98226.1 cytochrome C [Mesobaculum littorinae]
MKLVKIAATLATLAAPAVAQDHEGLGDAAAGEDGFRRCQSCHVVQDDEGNTLAGRNGRVGPNLYGVVGRTAGTVEGFRYSSSMQAAGEAGLVWSADTLVPYLQDPTAFLREYLDDSGARGKMSFRVRSEEDAQDLAAFLATFSEETAEGGDAADDDTGDEAAAD